MASPVYGRFAKYYDIIYHDLVNYEAECDYLEALFRKFLRGRPTSVLDLGCGSGNHALILARRRYAVTGIDLSRGLLREGRVKLRGSDLPVRFLHGDMRRFDVRRRFDAAICMFGGFGYMLTNRDVLSHFARVRRHLEPGGLYTFEFWQQSGVDPRRQFWIHREKPFRLIRLDRGRYDAARRRLTIDFDLLVFDDDRLKERFSESHTLRVYTVPEIRRLLSRAGLRLVAAYARGAGAPKGQFTPVRRDVFRVMAVAKPTRRRRHLRAMGT